MATPEELKKHTREVAHVQDMIFVDPEKAIPGTKLLINRKLHPYIPDSVSISDDDLLQKGKIRAWDLGFETFENVSNETGNESLYRALSKGLNDTEDHFKEIYTIGVLHMGSSGRSAADFSMTPSNFKTYVNNAMKGDVSGLESVNPIHVLSYFADAMSVRLVLFNACGKKWVGQEFVPFTSGTKKKIRRTAYALCFPTVQANQFAHVAKPLLPPIFKDNPPNQTMDKLRIDQIFRQNTMALPFSPPLGFEQRINEIKSMPFIVDLRCLYNDKEKDKEEDNMRWEQPPLGI